MALAEADRKVQRLLRVGGEEDEDEGGGERNNINSSHRKIIVNLNTSWRRDGPQSIIRNPYSKGQTGAHTRFTALCIRKDFAEYFHCLRKL